MVVKTVSSRASIIGRGAKCRGKSAVEQSAYISRTTLYSDYYGEKYYPKYSEDLVSTGVLIPDHAPREYLDHSKLWNSVEKVEKHAKAQLARLLKYSLPNWMSYELADKVVQDFIKQNFVDKGMCAEYAIHDSVNDKGERNLHVHILLTTRPILENGEWGEKSRKVYKYDKDGNKIKKKNGRYDCTTEKTTDWDNKGNAKMWRKDLVETINKVAEEIGIKDERWEWKSFKDRGLQIKPTIHLGEKATALERKGIRTDKGDYNREVRNYNLLVLKVVEIRREAFSRIAKGAGKVSETVGRVKNEVLELIHRTAAKKGVMSAPIVKSKYYAQISNREVLSDPKTAEDFITKNGITTFAQLREYITEHTKTADERDTAYKSKWQRLQDLKELAAVYAEYSRLRDVMKERQSQSIFTQKKYDKEHGEEIEQFPEVESRLLELKGDKKATPKAWAKEIEELEESVPVLRQNYIREVSGLAAAEVIEYTKKDMERIEANERRAAERQQPQRKKQQELS